MTLLHIKKRGRTSVCATDALINSLESESISHQVTNVSNVFSRNKHSILREKGIRTNCQNTIIFMALTLLCTCFQSGTNNTMNPVLVDAFMTPTPIRPMHQCKPITIQNQHCQQRRRKVNFSPSSLRMINTKSGGKPIITVEQFQSEVLLQTQQEIDGEVPMVVDEKEQNPILVLYSAPWYVGTNLK